MFWKYRPVTKTDNDSHRRPIYDMFSATKFTGKRNFDTEDIGKHPRVREEHVLMSSAIISPVEMKVLEADFISTVVRASERDQE